MASNIINKSKDVNNTTISDSSEEDPSMNSTQKYSKNPLASTSKVKPDWILLWMRDSERLNQ